MRIQISIALFALLLFCSIVTSRSDLRPDEHTDIGAEVTVDAPKLGALEKRRGGGGGGGGRGGGSSGGGSGGRSGGGGSSGGRSSSPGSRPSSTSWHDSSDAGSTHGSPYYDPWRDPYRTPYRDRWHGAYGSDGHRPGSYPNPPKSGLTPHRPNSNIGGSSRSGSGSTRSFAGGRAYAGGAAVPYTAGHRSPLGVVPFLLPLGALAFFPGIWLYGAYAYNGAHYAWHNATSNLNESIPITCLCQEYSVCGCEKNDNSTYINSLIKEKQPNGLPANSSDLVVANVNGTTGIYVNGTLPNGTTAPDPSIKEDAASSTFLKLSGYWVMVSFVVASIMLL